LPPPLPLKEAKTQLAGTGLHLFNISRKPGRVSSQNLFHSAPLGAPAALILSGLMGLLAESVRDKSPRESRVPSAAPQSALAQLTASNWRSCALTVEEYHLGSGVGFREFRMDCYLERDLPGAERHVVTI
jgi:hypothetical protein